VLQLVFLYFGKTHNHILNSNTIVDKSFKSEPFLLNTLKLTFQCNNNARNLLTLCSTCCNKRWNLWTAWSWWS